MPNLSFKTTLPKPSAPRVVYRSSRASGKALPSSSPSTVGRSERTDFMSLSAGKPIPVSGWKETADAVRKNAEWTLAEAMSAGAWSQYFEPTQLYTEEIIAWRIQREKLMASGVQEALAKAREYAFKVILETSAAQKTHSDKPRRWRTQQSRQ